MSWLIVAFDKKYDRSTFDCGSASLNDYVRQYISQDLKRGLAKAYLAITEDPPRVIGYYTVSSARVGCNEVPDKWKKRVGVYPVPCSLIGRLAVDKTMKGKGVGADLLMHAYHVIEQAAQHIGIKAVIVDAENKQAESFYAKFGFQDLKDQSIDGKKTMFIELDEALEK